MNDLPYVAKLVGGGRNIAPGLAPVAVEHNVQEWPESIVCEVRPWRGFLGIKFASSANRDLISSDTREPFAEARQVTLSGGFFATFGRRRYEMHFHGECVA